LPPARFASTPGSIGFRWAVIEVLPSAEIHVAASPPSCRGRKRSVLLPFSSKTKLSSSVTRPLRRLQAASFLLSIEGPIAYTAVRLSPFAD